MVFIADDKISAIIFVFDDIKYICENPNAHNRLSKSLRLSLLKLSNMSLSKSIIDLEDGEINNLNNFYKEFIASIKY